MRTTLIAALAFARPHDVTVVAYDYSFDAPDTIAAGVTTIHLMNQGHAMHHVTIVRLEDGHMVADLRAAVAHQGPWPRWITYFSGPNVPAPGGAVSTATIDLAPGTYLITCLVDQHAAMGMNKVLTVTGPYTRAALPRSDVTMTLVDYGFELSEPLTPGKHVIRVRNLASQPHEVFVARLAPGKKASDLLEWIKTFSGPPPMVPAGGLTPMQPGTEVEMTLVLTPGEYGLYCFMPDVGDGTPHVMHGMVRQITVEPNGYAQHE